MKPILDATAGNRMMWPNKNPPGVVFMDKEMGLARPPTVFGDFRCCPFRDDVFFMIIFDPPHSCSLPPWWNNPETQKKPRGNTSSWYGKFNSKVDMFSSIDKAQREFARLSDRLCFKWSELEVSLWKILVFFKAWIEVFKRRHRGKYKVGKTKTYWLTFERR